MAKEKKSSDEGMTKYGVQPDTLTKEATQGVEREEEAADKKPEKKPD